MQLARLNYLPNLYNFILYKLPYTFSLVSALAYFIQIYEILRNELAPQVEFWVKIYEKFKAPLAESLA